MMEHPVDAVSRPRGQRQTPARIIISLIDSDSKMDCGVAEAPLTQIAVEAFRSQIEIAGPFPFLFPNHGGSSGY
jgi:hypothetical protein